MKTAVPGTYRTLRARLVKSAILKGYKRAPHGLCTTLKDQVNEDVLAFIKS